MTAELPSYYRRDQKDGISPPDLGKDQQFPAEHTINTLLTIFSQTSVPGKTTGKTAPPLFFVGNNRIIT